MNLNEEEDETSNFTENTIDEKDNKKYKKYNIDNIKKNKYEKIMNNELKIIKKKRFNEITEFKKKEEKINIKILLMKNLRIRYKKYKNINYYLSNIYNMLKLELNIKENNENDNSKTESNKEIKFCYEEEMYNKDGKIMNISSQNEKNKNIGESILYFANSITFESNKYIDLPESENYFFIQKTNTGNKITYFYKNTLYFNKENVDVYMEDNLNFIYEIIAEKYNLILPIYEDQIYDYLLNVKNNNSNFTDDEYIFLRNKIKYDCNVYNSKISDEDKLPYGIHSKFKFKFDTNQLVDYNNNNQKNNNIKSQRKTNIKENIKIPKKQNNNKKIDNFLSPKNIKNTVLNKVDRNKNEGKNDNNINISENNNKNLHNQPKKLIEGILNYLDLVEDKYETILWNYLIKENEFIIYYNLKNENDRHIFYYNDEVKLYFKKKLEKKDLDEIKNLKGIIENIIKTDERIEKLGKKKNYIDDRIYLDTNTNKFKLLFDKYINNYEKIETNRNIINPYKYDYYKKSDYSIKKYKNSFFNELIDTTMLLNFPEKFFNKGIKKISNKSILCTRCNQSISASTAKRHMELTHIKLTGFEKSFLSIRESNKNIKKNTNSYKINYKQLLEFLKIFKSKLINVSSLIINSYHDEENNFEKENQRTNGRFYKKVKILDIIINRLNSKKKSYPFDLINKYNSLEENNRIYNFVINNLKKENYLPFKENIDTLELDEINENINKKIKSPKK